jgi:hypothetical protein
MRSSWDDLHRELVHGFNHFRMEVRVGALAHALFVLHPAEYLLPEHLHKFFFWIPLTISARSILVLHCLIYSTEHFFYLERLSLTSFQAVVVN